MLPQAAVLRQLDAGHASLAMLDRPPDVYDTGVEGDVVGLEGDDITPAEARTVLEPHGDRPLDPTEFLHRVEQRVALGVGRERAALDVSGVLALNRIVARFE